MKLEQLEWLIEIEKQQSISKAAKALYIGQSTLSGALSGLEEEIGVRLFERTASGVESTPLGKEAIQLAKQILELAEQMLCLGETQRQLHGNVTVSVGQAYVFLCGDLLIRFKQKYPKASLNINVCSPEEVENAIVSNNNNLILAFFPEDRLEIFKLKKRRLHYETFGLHPMLLYIGRNNRFFIQENVTLEELKNEKFVTNSYGFWDIMNRRIASKEEILVVSDRNILQQIISNGERIGILPDFFAKDNIYCEQGLIKTLEIICTPPLTMGNIFLIYPEGKNLTLLEQNTIVLLREILQDFENT